MNEAAETTIEFTPEYKGFIGYLEYTGQGVSKGLLDARKSAQAIIGFDKALRFVLGQEDPALCDMDFEIPVRLRSGSWQALIPETVGQWIVTALGVAASTYLAKAAGRMAEHDFKDKGLTTLFRGALQKLQWVVRLAKHLGTFDKKTFSRLSWRNNNQEAGVVNEEGQILYVPHETLDLFVSCPTDLLSDIVAVVEIDRNVRIAVIDKQKISAVCVGSDERRIFFVPKEEKDVLFPDLKHGQDVELDGLVTRGNENTNTLGFAYEQHILTCNPRNGSIVRFKECLFVKCRISGTISRLDDFGGTNNPRPKITFDNLEPIEDDDSETTLFSNGKE